MFNQLTVLASLREVALAELRMLEIKDRCVTAPEKRAVDECIAALRETFEVPS